MKTTHASHIVNTDAATDPPQIHPAKGRLMPIEFTIQRRVQFSETDMAGVMHFSNYFRWMEEVEHAFLRSVGLSVVHTTPGEEVSWPRVQVSCEYFAPLYFEEIVDVHMLVTDIREKSLTYEATFTKNGVRTARGRIKMVCCRWIDNRFESVEIPPSIRRRLESADANTGTA